MTPTLTFFSVGPFLTSDSYIQCLLHCPLGGPIEMSTLAHLKPCVCLPSPSEAETNNLEFPGISASQPTSHLTHLQVLVAFLIKGHPVSNPSATCTAPLWSTSVFGVGESLLPGTALHNMALLYASHSRLTSSFRKKVYKTLHSPPLSSLTSSPNIPETRPGLVLWCPCWLTPGTHLPQGLCK